MGFKLKLSFKPGSRIFIGFKRGAMVFLSDIASFNNFILMSFTYFIGVGISTVFIRVLGRHKKKLESENPTTYWKDLNIGEKPIDSYYRPF